MIASVRVGSGVLALVVAATMTMAGQARAGNIVVNGSFEDGLNGWTHSGTVGGSHPVVAINYNSTASYPTSAFGEAVSPNNALTNSPDAVGSHAAYFVDDFSTNEMLSQTVFLEAGIYQIGFSAYLPQNGFNNVGEATFSGSIAGVTLANFAASTQTAKTWNTYAGSTSIQTAGNYLISFTFNTNRSPSKDVVIDQVYVISGNPSIGQQTSAVPEPSTLALLASGAAFGLVRLRRKK